MTRPLLSSRIVCLTTETVEVLFASGEEARIARSSGCTVIPPRARKDKPKVFALSRGDLEKILAVEPDLVLGYSETQARQLSLGMRVASFLGALALSLERHLPASAFGPCEGPYWSHGGSPAWMDERRLAELGFDVARAKAPGPCSQKTLRRSAREVLVVLELAGTAWQQALEQACRHLRRAADATRGEPGRRAGAANRAAGADLARARGMRVPRGAGRP